MVTRGLCKNKVGRYRVVSTRVTEKEFNDINEVKGRLSTGDYLRSIIQIDIQEKLMEGDNSYGTAN